MNGNSTVQVQVGRGDDQAVAHVRLHTLGAFADRLGLGDVFSARIRPRGAGPAARSGHGVGGSHADARRGGVACNDIEHLRVPSPARATPQAWSGGLYASGAIQPGARTLHGTRARNIGFAVVARSTPRSTQPSPRR